jgi:tripartite-type tricarboxylate transporter receptor subunit TctC
MVRARKILKPKVEDAMRGVRIGILAVAVAALTALAGLRARAAETYPSRPIQVIVPFAGGSASDVVTRILLNRMSQELGQNFVVENRPGAGGNTGTAAATRATPDGYNLVMSTSGPLAANRTLFKDLGYDPEKELTPISLFATLPNVIVINSKLSPKTLPEFMQYAKEHPGINYGSVGVGSSQHLAGAYFEQVTGVKLTHVPYRNIANYTPDFIAGQVPLGFQFLPNVLGMLKNGDARALAVTSPKRMTALPNVPTAAQAGVKNYETFGWLALLGPAGMPKEAVEKIYAALKVSANDPAIRAKFNEQGAEATAPGPDALRDFITSETVKWRDIIQKAGIEPM